MKSVWSSLTLALSLVAALSAAACASNPLAPSVTSSSAATTIAAEVVPGVLKLQSLTRADATTVTISDPQQFTLEFLDNNRVAVKADCNRASGSFTVNGATLTIGPMAVTESVLRKRFARRRVSEFARRRNRGNGEYNVSGSCVGTRRTSILPLVRRL
jgi:heat shock protein HslJ